MPNEAIKILGPLSILIMFVAAVVLMRTWPQGKKSSLSQHGGAHRKAYWLFGGAMTVSAVMVYVFGRWWLAPTLGLVNLFNIALAAAVALQLFAAWVPYRGNGDKLSVWHNRAAMSMAFLLMILVGCIVFAASAPVIVHVAAGVALAYMLLAWYLFLFHKKTHDHFLVYQLIYLSVFCVVLLMAAYIR